MTASAGDGGPASLTIRSSRRGIVTPVLGVVAAGALAIALLVADGITVVSVVLGTFASLGLLAVLFDMPIATEFDRDGFVRITPLRRRRRSWDDIDRLSRNRSGWYRRRAGPGVGIVAVRGTFRYLLVDRTESVGDYERLVTILRAAEADWLVDTLDPPSGARRFS